MNFVTAIKRSTDGSLDRTRRLARSIIFTILEDHFGEIWVGSNFKAKDEVGK
jgi:hypothetical protein